LGKLLERHGPRLSAALGAVLTLWLASHLTVTNSRSLALLSSLVSAAAILAGFAVTSITIVLSVMHTETMQLLTAKGIDKNIYRYAAHAIYGLLSVVALSLVLICIPPPGDTVRAIVITMLGASLGYSIAAVLRVVLPLHALIDEVSKDEGD